MRGLKLPGVDLADAVLFVAPPAGAWIETQYGILISLPPAVAPPAGAWIETI